MTQLRIKHHVLTFLPRGSIALIFGRSTFILPKREATQFLKFRDILIRGFTDQTKIPKTVFQFISDQNLLIRRQFGAKNSKPKYSANEAERVLTAAIEMWKPLPGFHPLFSMINKNRSLQLSYLLEQTCFVYSAHNYLRLASRQAKSRALKKMLGNLASEERYHFIGLANDLGLSESDIANHDVAPGTQAIISYFHDLAVRNPSGLVVVSSLFETDTEELASTKKFYRSLERSLGLKLTHFVKHHELDSQLGHAATWKAAIGNRRFITHAELSDWLDCLHTAKHMIELWLDSILSEASRRKLARMRSSAHFLRPKPNAESIYVGE